MDYDPSPSDNTDTDDDLPPQQNRGSQAPHFLGNGNPMHQIHNIEKEAYFFVLRAFKAQSDAITWEQESLITELRKDLRVSGDEHRELLSKVNNDDMIRTIREWRQGGGHLATSNPMNDIGISTPRKKPRTSQSLAFHALPSTNTTPVQPSPLGLAPPRGTKPKQYPFRGSIGVHGLENLMPEQLIGRKVLTRWPDDNHFYEAVIDRYNASDGRHALVYGKNTPDESFEWVNFMEISPDDIRWVDEVPGLSHRGGVGDKKSMRHGAVTGGGRNPYRNKLDNNGSGNMRDDIEILHTGALIKEVERVVASSNPDRLELERAKNLLKEHEQALVDAISKLTYVSDGDSDGD